MSATTLHEVPLQARAPGRALRRRHPADETLRFLIILMMIAPLLSIALADSELTIDDRLMSGMVWVLCLLPSYVYLGKSRAKRQPIPFLPFIAFQFGVFFVLQGVLGTVNLYGRFDVAILAPTLDPRLYHQSVQLVALGWSLLLVGYYGTRAMTRPARPSRIGAQLSWRAMALLGTLFVSVGLVSEVLKRLPGSPLELRGLLYFSAMFSLFGIALWTVLRVRRKLPPSLNLVYFGVVLTLLFLQFGTSATAQVVILLVTLLFALWIGGQRVRTRWVLIGLFGLGLALTMRGVANEHRRGMERAPNLTMLDRSRMLVTLMQERVTSGGSQNAVGEGWRAAMQRSALLDLFTDVIRQTPQDVPYWGGQTYLSLVGAFVPRFLWRDKPAKMLGYEFGHRYHYLAEWDYSTTINFPFLIEFYANFGVLGVLVGMVLVGVIYATIERFINVPGQSLLVSVMGLGLLLPLGNVESDFSLVFGGVFLNGLAVYLVLRSAQRGILANWLGTR